MIENLQTEPIYVRSPYDIVVDENLQTSGKVELFVWNNGDTPPTVPTYVTEKKIPAPDQLKLIFNISNYIIENIEFTLNDLAINQNYEEIDANEWCFVKVKRYTLIEGDPDFTLLDTKTYIALEGYGKYKEGGNATLGNILLEEGTYEYLYDANYLQGVTNQPYGYRYGDIKIVLPQVDYTIRYTDLITGATFDSDYLAPLGTRYVTKSFLVYPLFAENGNKVEIFDELDNLLWTSIMLPIRECKYTPVTIDFVNKFGAWQRTFFFKASRRSLSVIKQEYDFLARDIAPYDTNLPQRKQFNVNAKESLRANTGWITDEYYTDQVLIPMMLTEEIRIALSDFNNVNSLQTYPAKLNTQSTELFENINQHMINYELTFEHTFDYINNVV